MSHVTRTLDRLRPLLSQPVDGASLALFRICFGLAVAYSMFQFLTPVGNTTLAGFQYGDVDWNFTYPGFSWVKPLPAPYLHWPFVITGVAALLMAAGLFYRPAAVVVFLGYTWYFLLDETYYNNHYYLISLLAFLLIWMPADRRFALRRRKPDEGTLVPFWPILLLRGQFLVVYLFASLAKFNADWFTGEPMIGTGDMMFTAIERWVSLPGWLTPLHLSLALCWIGLVFDLVIGILLLIRRTQLLGIALLATFHGINALFLPIGVFPFLGFAGSLIFLSPGWPVQLFQWLRSPRFKTPDWNWFKWGGIAVPVYGMLMGWELPKDSSEARPAVSLVPGWVVGFCSAWLIIQVLLPFRHFLISGDASWTEEGQMFAWRMMLRQKASGFVTMTIQDPQIVEPSPTSPPKINWTELPPEIPRGVFVTVDAPRFQWDRHPGMSMFYEGLLGYRVVYVPRATDQEAIEAELALLAANWQKKTGRKPAVRQALPLTQCLDQAVAQLEAATFEKQQQQLELLQAVRQQVADLAETKSGREQHLKSIHEQLSYALRHDHQDILARSLRQVIPFDLIGGAAPAHPVYLVEQLASANELQELSEQLGRSDSYFVFLDLSRLPPDGWMKLPTWFLAHSPGGVLITWNPFRELNTRQLDALAAQPWMIRQYSRHIADAWEAEFQRRPQVHASTYVMMNYRYPHHLVDPDEDLAAAEYSFWKHNDWILPMTERKIDIAEQVENGRAARR